MPDEVNYSRLCRAAVSQIHGVSQPTFDQLAEIERACTAAVGRPCVISACADRPTWVSVRFVTVQGDTVRFDIELPA